MGEVLEFNLNIGTENNEEIDFEALLRQQQPVAKEEPEPVAVQTKESALNAALEDPYEVPMQDFFETARRKIDTFDQKAWAAKSGYEAPDFPLWSKHMEGLENGFFIFAGFPNSGKTAYMMNLARSYAAHKPNKLYLIYYTLDDTAQKLIPRFIAMNKSIPISVAAKPGRYQDKIDNGEEGTSVFQELLNKRAQGLEELKNFSDHMLIAEQEDIECSERMLNHAKMIKAFIQARDPEANILVCIDSLMDITVDSANDRDEKERNTRISRMMKTWADTELQCPIFGSAHLRKNTAAKRPVVSDLKESGRYEYDATAIFLVANDVSRNGQNAEIYYNSPNDDEKHPVLEIQWAKNKASSFKERTYCFFTPNYSKATECNEELTKQYDAKIYSA